MGVGSELRGDDAIGLMVVRRLQAQRKSASRLARSQRPALKIISGGTAPENFTGAIRQFQPSHLLIIDAADLGRKPGAVAVLSPKQSQGISFATHRLPLTLLVDYLAQNRPLSAWIIGIQPHDLAYGRPLSPPVAAAARRCVQALKAALGKAHWASARPRSTPRSSRRSSFSR